MNEIWEFIKYAFWCVGNMFTAQMGRGEFTENWIQDTIVGFFTLIILMFISYWFFRFTGLLKVEKKPK